MMNAARIIYLLTLITLLGFCISNTIVIAENYEITIINKTYETKKTETKGALSATYYDIIITIKNCTKFYIIFITYCC